MPSPSRASRRVAHDQGSRFGDHLGGRRDRRVAPHRRPHGGHRRGRGDQTPGERRRRSGRARGRRPGDGGRGSGVCPRRMGGRADERAADRLPVAGLGRGGGDHRAAAGPAAWLRLGVRACPRRAGAGVTSPPRPAVRPTRAAGGWQGHKAWQERIGTPPEQVASWWAGRPYSLLLATGYGYDAIEVGSALGTGAARALRSIGLPVPIIGTPTGRWMFLTESGPGLTETLAQHGDVVLHSE